MTVNGLDMIPRLIGVATGDVLEELELVGAELTAKR